MRVLVLGGTVFLGRALVAALAERGHDVTTFTRGTRLESDAPPATRIHGDRQADLTALPRAGWDAVIDTSGYRPAVVRASATHLAESARYAFVSTISVYDMTQPELDEESSRPPLAPGTAEDAPEAYGPLKARCEDEVRAVFGARALIVRPGLIVGPYDPTDRFTYWPQRAARGGAILAPAPAERFVQFVDVRDVADFLVTTLERSESGTFNVTGLPRTTTMGDVVEASRAAAGTASHAVWVDEEFLVQHGAEPWTGLPLWIPQSMGLPGLSNVNVRRAVERGLAPRGLSETVRDTLAWARSRPPDGAPAAGLSAQRESELLAAWRDAT
jgi:2'-hydroxyisoflavone reductase